MNTNIQIKKQIPVKRWFITFIILATILVFVLQLILTLLQNRQPLPSEPPIVVPEKPSIQTTLTQEQNIQTFEYIGPTPTLPKTLPIYQNQNSLPPISLTKLQELAIAWNMEKSSSTSLWTQKEFGYSLFYDSETNTIRYTGNIPPQTEMQTVRTEEAILLAKEALALFSPTLELAPQLSNIQFLKGESELTQTIEEQATYFSIPFSLSFSGYSFSHTGTTNNPATVLVDSQGYVRKIFIHNVAYQPVDGGHANVRSIPEMISSMKNGTSS